eukprot:TRINITY_DN38794_c0_g1_i1.p1 TRINITY_DN38794_c0_g1~~TRINITY_DN38794_c0_g1_i1.p1  ORF type:complete len:385 (+),score=52.73 TRINITY_DN38794_c0_g1_i1:95-1249(+)
MSCQLHGHAAPITSSSDVVPVSEQIATLRAECNLAHEVLKKLISHTADKLVSAIAHSEQRVIDSLRGHVTVMEKKPALVQSPFEVIEEKVADLDAMLGSFEGGNAAEAWACDRQVFEETPKHLHDGMAGTIDTIEEAARLLQGILPKAEEDDHLQPVAATGQKHIPSVGEPRQPVANRESLGEKPDGLNRPSMPSSRTGPVGMQRAQTVTAASMGMLDQRNFTGSVSLPVGKAQLYPGRANLRSDFSAATSQSSPLQSMQSSFHHLLSPSQSARTFGSTQRVVGGNAVSSQTLAKPPADVLQGAKVANSQIHSDASFVKQSQIQRHLTQASEPGATARASVHTVSAGWQPWYTSTLDRSVRAGSEIGKYGPGDSCSETESQFGL